MKLDLTSLEKAISQLDKTYGLALSDEAKANADWAQAFRLAAIKALAFTYDLSCKMLRRFLKMSAPNPEAIDDATFQSLIRLASERGLLLSDLPRWMEYRKQRGTTSHAYDEKKALEAFSVVPDFLKEAHHLHGKLKERAASL